MNWFAGVIELLLAADPAPADAASQGPVIVIVGVLATLAGTALTALAPALLQAVKNRGSRLAPVPPGSPPVPAGASPPANPAPPLPLDGTPASNQMVQSAQIGFTMVEAAVLDYRSQRDAAQLRYDRVLQDLDEAQDIIRDQAVYIATLEGRLGMAQNYGGRHGSSPQPPQNRNRP